MSSFVLTSSDPELLTRAFFIIFLARSAASRSRSSCSWCLKTFLQLIFIGCATRSRTRTYVYTFAHTHALTCTHLHTHTYTYTHLHSHTHLRAHIRTRTCIRTQALPHTQMLSDGTCYIGEKSLLAHLMANTKNVLSLLAQRTVFGTLWHTWLSSHCKFKVYSCGHRYFLPVLVLTKIVAVL